MPPGRLKLGLISAQVGPKRFHRPQLIRARHTADWHCDCHGPNMEEPAPASKAKRLNAPVTPAAAFKLRP
jgi:hypothetical protein